MCQRFSLQAFYEELKSQLPTSCSVQRKEWASIIISENIDLKRISSLLHSDKKIGLRYAWLLSDIGTLNPIKLHTALPYLLKQGELINHFDFKKSFANYWLICGVPLENEATAIDLLFKWILSNNVNVTTKARSLKVLINLTVKHPELKIELQACLENQINKHSLDFDKKIKKALMEINQ